MDKQGTIMAKGKFVAYYRVSTDRQGRSGLGLDAQQKAVRDHLGGNGWELVGEYTEVESGKRNTRPELQEALAQCRKEKATLVIAKLDRLSRNATFLLTLHDAGVEIRAVDMPDANRFVFGILALVAEHEREQISQRTKAALAAAKARGVKLGSPDPSQGRAVAARVNRDKAGQFAANVLPIIGEIQASGATSLRAIAKALNARGVPTARGGHWGPQAVANVLARA